MAAKKPSPAEIAARADAWADLIPALAETATTGLVTGSRPVQRESLTAQEVWYLYAQDWLAREAVQRVADDACRVWPRVVCDDADVAPGVERYLKRIRARAAFTTANRWARLFGGGAILIGTADSGGWEEPLKPERVASIRWLLPLDRRQVYALAWDDDFDSPTFARPSLWQVSVPVISRQIIVHPSRILIFQGETQPLDFEQAAQGWGLSVLESRFEAIRNASTGDQNAAVALQRFAINMLKMDNLAEMLASSNGIARALKRINAFRACMAQGKVALIDRNHEEFAVMGQPVAGMAELMAHLRRSAAGAVDIPDSRLYGQAQGTARAGADSDDRTYSEDVGTWQEMDVIPQFTQLVGVILAAKDGPTGGRVPEFDTEATPIRSETKAEKAEIASKRAATAKIYIDAGVLEPIEVRQSEAASGDWGYTTDPALDAEIAEGEDEPEPVPLPPPPPAEETPIAETEPEDPAEAETPVS